jgi:glycosyltransferase involved in cell wall biosynthesis
MRVLYVNHTAEVSGAERSLLDLVSGLPETASPRVAAPRGRLTQITHQRGVPTTPIPGTTGSLRLHPLHTPRAFGEMAAAAHHVRLAARRHEADLVHANSIRAGIVLGLARLSSATVVHVRDCLPPGPISTATQRLLATTATTIVANSAYTAKSVTDVAPGACVEVVHNPVDLQRWDPSKIDPIRARAALGEVGQRALVMGVVAQLSPWKGQDTAIEALRLLRDQDVDAHLLLIGSAKFVARATRFDNAAYVESLRRKVSQAGLDDRVSWLGERDDVPELVRALDLLLLPSWEEPFGRALIEAMALNVPVIATSIGGPPEIIEDGREGYLVAPRDPVAWAAAIRRLAEEPRRGWEMGRAGRRRVEEQFTLQRHVDSMLDVYQRTLARAEKATRDG